MYLLDTNICIYAMKNTYPALTDKLFRIPPSEVFISSITGSPFVIFLSPSQDTVQTPFVSHKYDSLSLLQKDYQAV